MYKPLPDSLTISPSPIDGLGLFATSPIPSDTTLGLSHVRHSAFPQHWIRTPLGGFYNHSFNPNCVLKEVLIGSSSSPTPALSLISLTDIEPGEELTATYTLYSLSTSQLQNEPENL